MLDLLSNGNRLHLEDDLFDDDEEAATANNHENGHENNNKSSKNKRKRNRKKKSNNKGNAIEMTPSEKNDETNEGEAADIDNHIEIEYKEPFYHYLKKTKIIFSELIILKTSCRGS